MWIYYTHMYIIVLLKLAYPNVTDTLFPIHAGQSFLLCMALGYILNRIQKIPSCSKIEILIHQHIICSKSGEWTYPLPSRVNPKNFGNLESYC